MTPYWAKGRSRTVVEKSIATVCRTDHRGQRQPTGAPNENPSPDAPRRPYFFKIPLKVQFVVAPDLPLAAKVTSFGATQVRVTVSVSSFPSLFLPVRTSETVLSSVHLPAWSCTLDELGRLGKDR
jgi:hypothetical protein